MSVTSYMFLHIVAVSYGFGVVNGVLNNRGVVIVIYKWCKNLDDVRKSGAKQIYRINGE